VLIQSIHYTFAPEDADRVAAILIELRDLSRQEPGIMQFEVARGQDRPNIFALWEVYRDDAALKAHLESDHFQRLGINGIRRLATERLAEIALPL